MAPTWKKVVADKPPVDKLVWVRRAYGKQQFVKKCTLQQAGWFNAALWFFEGAARNSVDRTAVMPNDEWRDIVSGE